MLKIFFSLSQKSKPFRFPEVEQKGVGYKLPVKAMDITKQLLQTRVGV